MLLAAVLGALAAELVPAYGTHLPVSAWAWWQSAVLGTLLPVPMAFDVGLAWVLYRAGVPAAYVTTLLCTLGVVSIYSLTALGQQLGRAAVLRLGGAVALLGAIAGFLLSLELKSWQALPGPDWLYGSPDRFRLPRADDRTHQHHADDPESGVDQQQFDGADFKDVFEAEDGQNQAQTKQRPYPDAAQ